MSVTVIMGGQKKEFVSASVIIGGVKTSLTN